MVYLLLGSTNKMNGTDIGTYIKGILTTMIPGLKAEVESVIENEDGSQTVTLVLKDE